MIFDLQNWLRKSEFFDLHDQIHNQALIYQRPLKVRISPWFDVGAAEKNLNGIYLAA